MAEFTKEEQVQAIYDLKVGYALGHADIAMLKSMARQLLAGLEQEQEPVAWVSDKDKCDPDVFERGITACVLAISKNEAETICRGFSAATGCKVDWHFVGGRVHIKALRAAPQLPQPAVPDENGLLRCPFCGSTARVVDNRLGFYVKCNSDNCDGFAIGPRIPELQSEQEGKIIDWESLAQAAKDKWNRRAAMLQGKAEPVSQPYMLPAGMVAVPIEPTEDMIIHGFESVPHPLFQPADWDKYQEMSGCQKAAHRAKLYWAAMIAAAPQQEV